MKRIVTIFAACAMLSLSGCVSVPTASAHDQSPREDLAPVHVVEQLLGWEGQYGSGADAEHMVLIDESGWTRLWRSLGQNPPPLDFTKYYAVVVMAGMRTTGGYTIEFLDPVAKGIDVTVRYLVKAPAGFATQAITYPWKIRAFPRVVGKVSIEKLTNTTVPTNPVH